MQGRRLTCCGWGPLAQHSTSCRRWSGLTAPLRLLRPSHRAVNVSVTIISSQWNKDSPALRRPALSVTYSTDPAVPPPTPSYPVTLGAVSRVWWVDPLGSDELNSGHFDSPFKSPAMAITVAWPGDKIYLTTGVYPGALNIERPGITLQSAPGHWGVVSLPMTDPQDAVNVITLRPGADYGVIQVRYNPRGVGVRWATEELGIDGSLTVSSPTKPCCPITFPE